MSEPTGVSLQKHLESQIDGVRRELLLIQEAQRIATSKSEEAQQLRNEAMNEWRGTVQDILSRAATKEQIEALAVSLRAVIEAMEKALERQIHEGATRIGALEKKGTGQAGWIAGAAAAGAIVLSILMWYFASGRGG